MASFLYNNYCNLMMGGGSLTLPDLSSDTINVGIVDTSTDYTSPVATHTNWSDTGYTEDTCYNSDGVETLTGKDVGSTTTRVFDAADVTFASVAIDGSKTVDAIVHYAAIGAGASTDPLICYHDGFTPVTPNGGDIVISYNASGIFGL